MERKAAEWDRMMDATRDADRTQSFDTFRKLSDEEVDLAMKGISRNRLKELMEQKLKHFDQLATARTAGGKSEGLTKFKQVSDSEISVAKSVAPRSLQRDEEEQEAKIAKTKREQEAEDDEEKRRKSKDEFEAYPKFAYGMGPGMVPPGMLQGMGPGMGFGMRPGMTPGMMPGMVPNMMPGMAQPQMMPGMMPQMMPAMPGQMQAMMQGMSPAEQAQAMYRDFAMQQRYGTPVGRQRSMSLMGQQAQAAAYAMRRQSQPTVNFDQFPAGAQQAQAAAYAMRRQSQPSMNFDQLQALPPDAAMVYGQFQVDGPPPLSDGIMAYGRFPPQSPSMGPEGFAAFNQQSVGGTFLSPDGTASYSQLQARVPSLQSDGNVITGRFLGSLASLSQRQSAPDVEARMPESYPATDIDRKVKLLTQLESARGVLQNHPTDPEASMGDEVKNRLRKINRLQMRVIDDILGSKADLTDFVSKTYEQERRYSAKKLEEELKSENFKRLTRLDNLERESDARERKPRRTKSGRDKKKIVVELPEYSDADSHVVTASISRGGVPMQASRGGNADPCPVHEDSRAEVLWERDRDDNYDYPGPDQVLQPHIHLEHQLHFHPDSAQQYPASSSSPAPPAQAPPPVQDSSPTTKAYIIVRSRSYGGVRPGDVSPPRNAR